MQGIPIWKNPTGKTQSKPLLLLVQLGKSRHLRSYLSRHHINYLAPDSYCAYLRDHTCSPLRRGGRMFEQTLRITQHSSLYQCVCEYFTHLDSYDASVYPLLSKHFFSDFASPLITDAYHDSFVRRLYVQIQALKDWQFISIPEGADSFYARASMDQFAKGSGGNHKKYVFSPYERQLGINSGEPPAKIKVCGYNTALFACSIYGFILRIILRLFLGASGKKIIFFNHHLLRKSDFGIDRLSELNDKQLSQEISSLLASIDLDQYYILTSGRCSQRRLELIGCGSIRRINVHWSILCSACDLMISSRSSLLLEAAALGVPTIFWDPLFQKANQFYSQTLPSQTQIVRSSVQLRSALRRLARRSTRCEVSDSSNYLSPPSYRQLLDDIC